MGCRCLHLACQGEVRSLAPPVSYTTVVDLRCMLSLYKNRIFGFQGIRSCKTAFFIRMYGTPHGVPEFYQGCTNVIGCTGVLQMCAVQEQSHSLKHNLLFSSSVCELFTSFKTVSFGEYRLYFPACLNIICSDEHHFITNPSF